MNVLFIGSHRGRYENKGSRITRGGKGGKSLDIMYPSPTVNFVYGHIFLISRSVSRSTTLSPSSWALGS